MDMRKTVIVNLGDEKDLFRGDTTEVDFHRGVVVSHLQYTDGEIVYVLQLADSDKFEHEVSVYSGFVTVELVSK